MNKLEHINQMHEMFVSDLNNIQKITGMTTKEMAKRVGVSAGTLSEWKNGKRRPRFEHLVLLFDSFGDVLAELHQDNGLLKMILDKMNDDDIDQVLTVHDDFNFN